VIGIENKLILDVRYLVIIKNQYFLSLNNVKLKTKIREKDMILS